MVFNVSEDDLPQVQAQLKGNRKLEVDAFDRADDKQIATGTLTSLDNEVDTTTGTVKFRAEFANKDLSPVSQPVRERSLLVRTLENVTLVPTPPFSSTEPRLRIYRQPQQYSRRAAGQTRTERRAIDRRSGCRIPAYAWRPVALTAWKTAPKCRCINQAHNTRARRPGRHLRPAVTLAP